MNFLGHNGCQFSSLFTLFISSHPLISGNYSVNCSRPSLRFSCFHFDSIEEETVIENSLYLSFQWKIRAPHRCTQYVNYTCSRQDQACDRNLELMSLLSILNCSPQHFPTDQLLLVCVSSENHMRSSYRERPHQVVLCGSVNEEKQAEENKWKKRTEYYFITIKIINIRL